MAEPRMKSSWEIAMERAEKLGKPSPEEIRKRREETCLPIGQALARKYLSGLPVRDLNIELDKYGGEDLKVVTGALLAELRGSISLDGPEQTERVIEAWRLLRPEAGMDKVVTGIRTLLAEYEKANMEEQERAAPAAEEDVMRELAAEGIAGGALSVNLKKAASRPAPVEGLRKEYEGRLAKLTDQLPVEE